MKIHLTKKFNTTVNFHLSRPAENVNIRLYLESGGALTQSRCCAMLCARWNTQARIEFTHRYETFKFKTDLAMVGLKQYSIRMDSRQ